MKAKFATATISPTVYAKSVQRLRFFLGKKSTLATICLKRSRRGDGGTYAVLVARPDRAIVNISGLVSDLTGRTWDTQGAVWSGSDTAIIEELKRIINRPIEHISL